MHVVVIGDVIASRASPDRKALQEELTRGAALANQLAHRAAEPLSPYTITLGDEVQAVYARPSNVVVDILAFQSALWPVKMRFCVGLGSITTKLNTRAAIGMDGPAFYCAREGIEELKNDRTSSLAVKAERGIDVSVEDSAIRLIHASMASWRETRFKLFLALLRGADVKEIPGHLGISLTAAYKNLSDGRIALLIDAAKAIGASLERKLVPSPAQRRRSA
ncbi:MAG TPA: SatD family protein [Polyangia bacterium]|nr:SatD family protein [Polyangia bacterium]